jgi:cell division septation protein DedD
LDKKLVPQTDSDKLKAFVQKLHDEGAAGFAAGPWSIGEGSTATGPVIRDRRASIRLALRHFGSTLRRHSEPILNGLAMLSIAAIIVGIIGVNLTEEPGEQLVAARATGSIEAPPSQSDGKQLTEIKRKLLLTTRRLDTLAAEFRRLKRHTNISATDERRLHTLENKLLLTVSRLDILSAEILDLKNANNMILASTKAAPPAALPVDARAPARSRPHSMPSSPAKPAPLFGQEQPQHPEEPEPIPFAAASPVPEPVPAATASPAPDPQPVTVAAASPAPDPQPVTVAAASPAPDPQPVTVAAAIPAPDPLPAPATRTVGGWVVNLASYNGQKTADRYVAELKQSGITAERAEATVNGRTMHRVRVAGFDSYSAAKVRAGTLKQELDLPGIWIARK